MKFSNIECPSPELIQWLIKHKKVIEITIEASMGENPITGVPIHYDEAKYVGASFSPKILWCFVGDEIDARGRRIDVESIRKIKVLKGTKSLIWKLENNM